MSEERPSCIIGVRDSGVGGLTVARCIKRVMPHAQLLYFADTAHVPYGDRAPEEVRFFALSISEFLIQNGAQSVVFACNTSSAYALEAAQQRFSVPIFGMIEPGARAALQTTRNNRIGVLATQATVDSGVYSQTITRLQPQARCIEVACPAFVPLVESEQTASCEAEQAARKYLAPLLAAGVDTIVLGCTHYPLLLPVLRELAPECSFIDPAEAVAVEVEQALNRTTSASKYFEADRCYISGETAGVQHWMSRLLPQTRTEFLSGPIFEMSG